LKRTIAITGASAGVGRAIANTFAQRGWQVAALARGDEGLLGTQQAIEKAGARALAIEADVSDASAVVRAAQRIERELGPIDVWVNNAMVTIYAPIVEITPEEFLQVTRITYLGQVHGTLAALKFMSARNRGHIIYVGSALAYRSIPFQAPYCAAKAAVRGFVDSLRSELLYEGSKIRLTMLQLPAVNTPQFDWARNKFDREVAPVPPIFQPETIADAVLKALEEAPREYWIGASAAKAIIAQMVMPALVDRYLAKVGKASETTSQPKKALRSDNLFTAGKGDPGAHGRFDACAERRAFIFNPEWLRMGAAIGILALVFRALIRSGRQVL
jgi:short-subunit dehydrogenase